uniref:Uncharacterized protein n=1 Tax=Arundo donax TaxID=35708 RepID=A0A0A9B2S6_ARUDO
MARSKDQAREGGREAFLGER